MKLDPREVAYARRWESLAPKLEVLREQDIRNADTQAAIRLFDTAYRMAVRDLAPRETSGLVEWQKIVLRWRDRG